MQPPTRAGGSNRQLWLEVLSERPPRSSKKKAGIEPCLLVRFGANYFFISSFLGSAFFADFLLFFLSLLLSAFFASPLFSIGAAPVCDAARAKPLDSAKTMATRMEISFLIVFLSVKLRNRL